MADLTPIERSGPTPHNSAMSTPQDDFETEANAPPPTLLREFLDFARETRKWWLIPLVAIFLGFGLLLGLASTGAAPFIYSIF